MTNRQGDEAAFEQIFREYYPRLVAIGERLLGDRAQSEDVAQEVLLELWRGRARFDPSVQVSAYLYRSVRNRALNDLRHQRVVRQATPRLSMTEPPPGPDRAVLEQELDAAVRSAVGELPERCREVFELSRVDQLSYAEIAEVMGITLKTVEAHMGKAIKVLRQALSPWLQGQRSIE